MDHIEAIVADLNSIHGISVPKTLFEHATIYTTEEYRREFAKKWGYEVRATGVLLPAQQWHELQEMAGIARHLAAQEYLPHRCTRNPQGFVIIKLQQNPLWNQDHEMLHFAHYANSAGFRALIRQYELDHDSTIAIPRIEAEMLYEVCAFRDNVSLGVPDRDWNWATTYLVERYLPAEVALRSKETHANIESSVPRLASELRGIIDLVQSSPLSAAEMTACFFSIAYNSPFAEFRQRIEKSRK